jgi:UDP-2,3-diacylglucosamine pyrophosphatase LpxH
MISHTFREASFTAIISDLHLCEAQPINPKYPLWKKYKTEEFFFDNDFREFLREIEIKAGAEKVELILNGDIFDFDSVLKIPTDPLFRVDWLERKRGLHSRSERSVFKFRTILEDHPIFVESLREFLIKGHRVVIIFGNHDLELHFPEVQEELINQLNLPNACHTRLRFVDWFYISNQDTLVEHGNQYDPYCLCEDPVHPFCRGYNFIFLRLPFGNLACRYILNGLGFFNPHVDSNYIMTMGEYIRIFLRYMARAQPLLLVTWFWGSVVTLYVSIKDHLEAPLRNPLRSEDRVSSMADRANADPRMIREMKELIVNSAASRPFLLMRELWLDRAFILLLSFYVVFQIMSFIKGFVEISLFWAFIPLFLFLPFFLFYSKSVRSLVSGYKEPDDRILQTTSAITRVKRIVYGHTHHARHEIIGSVEHLNSGCWSPAFLDIECTMPLDQKNYVWISPSDSPDRKAELIVFKKTEIEDTAKRIAQ